MTADSHLNFHSKAVNSRPTENQMWLRMPKQKASTAARWRSQLPTGASVHSEHFVFQQCTMSPAVQVTKLLAVISYAGARFEPRMAIRRCLGFPSMVLQSQLWQVSSVSWMYWALNKVNVWPCFTTSSLLSESCKACMPETCPEVMIVMLPHIMYSILPARLCT